MNRIFPHYGRCLCGATTDLNRLMVCKSCSKRHSEVDKKQAKMLSQQIKEFKRIRLMRNRK